MKNSKCLPNERRQLRDQLTRSCVFFPIKRASSTISAIGAKEPSNNQWNMLMPVREYNKHIAKIPNCKMRQRPTLRAAFASLLLLLHVAQALDPGAASGAGGGSGAAAGGAGPASTGGASGGSLSSGPPTFIANLTEQGSPAAWKFGVTECHKLHNAGGQRARRLIDSLGQKTPGTMPDVEDNKFVKM